MELLLQRKKESSEWTLGELFIEDTMECFTLEDQSQEKKVMHETRIPAGRYQVLLRTEGGHHERYSKKFPEIHKGMLHLQNVPRFTWILIHIGNDDDDSSGCILVGEDHNGNGFLLRSTAAYLALYKKVVESAENKELWITVKDIPEEAFIQGTVNPDPTPPPPK